MDFYEDRSESLNIEAYTDNSVTIAGEDYQQNIIVTAEKIIPWSAQANDLVIADFDIVIEQQAEIFILGYKTKGFNLNPNIQAKLQQQLGLEIMKLDAACRTFTILMAESRNAVLGLLFS